MRMTMQRWVGSAAALGAALAASPAAVRAQSEPLTLTEVLDMQRRGVSAQQILRAAQQYCVSFPMTDSVERQLSAAGANVTLAGGIRGACVVSPSRLLPSGVLVDDDFESAGRFAAADRLCVVRQDARGMRVENNRPSGGCAIPYPFEAAGGDLRIEVTAVALTGDAVPVVVLGFGRDTLGWDQHTFAITGTGDIELGATTAGKFRQLRFQRKVAAVRTGRAAENEMAVEIRGSAIDVFVNDQRVLRYAADRRLGRGISLGVGPSSSVVFTKLVVRKADTEVSIQ